MPTKPFFPDPVFAWLFVGVLIGLAAVAAWYDTRQGIIPKWLTLGTLGLGLVANLVRGAMMGGAGKPLWVLETGSPWAGMADGLLFALAGFGFAFGLYFVIWILGLCGGGDVKLMSGLGAWLGLAGVVYLLIVSTAVLFVWMVGKVVFGGLTPSAVRKSMKTVPSTQRRDRSAAPTARPGKARVTFSFPAAVAVVVVLLWVFRVDLQLAPPKPAPQAPQGNAHVARPPAPPSSPPDRQHHD